MAQSRRDVIQHMQSKTSLMHVTTNLNAGPLSARYDVTEFTLTAFINTKLHQICTAQS